MEFRKIKVEILGSDKIWARFDLTQIRSPIGFLEGKLRQVPSAFKNPVIQDLHSSRWKGESSIQSNWLLDQCLKVVSGIQGTIIFFFLTHKNINKMEMWVYLCKSSLLYCCQCGFLWNRNSLTWVYQNLHLCSTNSCGDPLYLYVQKK